MAGTRSVPSPRRRLLAVLLLGVLPWTVVISRDVTLVFAFGLVNNNPLHLTDIYSYLFVHTAGLPRRLQAWPAGVVLHACALASALAGLIDREDPRLTGGLLVFAGISHGQVAFGLYRVYGFGTDAIVLPVGALATLAVVWWVYWPGMKERGLGPLD